MKSLARLLAGSLVLSSIAIVPSVATAQTAPAVQQFRPDLASGMTDVSVEPKGTQVFAGVEGNVPTIYRMTLVGRSRDEYTVEKIVLDSTLVTVGADLRVRSVDDARLEIVNRRSKRVTTTHVLDAANDRTVSLATLAPGRYFVLVWNDRRASLLEVTIPARR